MNRTVPSGAVIITIISTILVFVLGTDTLTRIGVISDGNEIVIEASVEVKSTPDEPGLRSLGLVLSGAPLIVTLLIYCGLFMPSVDGQITVVV